MPDNKPLPTWHDVEYVTLSTTVDDRGVHRWAVERFPDVISISEGFMTYIKTAPAPGITRNSAEQTIGFASANGLMATYHIVEYSTAREAYLCQRIA